MKQLKIFLVIIVPVFLFATVGCNDENGDDLSTAEVEEFDANSEFENWDLDDSDDLDENEFGGGVRGISAEFDSDKDDVISEEEYGAGIFSHWDANNNDKLEESEFNDNIKGWSTDEEATDFSSWDLDQDGGINKNEWNTAWRDHSNFREWDRDQNNSLDQDEFSSGLYKKWDEDQDLKIDKEEFDRNYRYWSN